MGLKNHSLISVRGFLKLKLNLFLLVHYEEVKDNVENHAHDLDLQKGIRAMTKLNPRYLTLFALYTTIIGPDHLLHLLSI